jgi:hypothetical protein
MEEITKYCETMSKLSAWKGAMMASHNEKLK